MFPHEYVLQDYFQQYMLKYTKNFFPESDLLKWGASCMPVRPIRMPSNTVFCFLTDAQVIMIFLGPQTINKLLRKTIKLLKWNSFLSTSMKQFISSNHCKSSKNKEVYGMFSLFIKQFAFFQQYFFSARLQKYLVRKGTFTFFMFYL